MKKIIVTSFTPGVDINKEFRSALETFSKKHDAPIKYIQTKENYKKDINGWDKLDKLNEDFLMGRIEDGKYDDKRFKIEATHNFNKDTEELMELAAKQENLTENLVLSDMKLNPNLVDPISGLDSLVARMGNLILGFPRQRFKTVPRSLKHSKTPRGIWCTGTVSKPYYKDTKTGIRMSPYHQFGALLVMVEDCGSFHVRQLQANPDGSFYDLLNLYKPDGTIEKITEIAGMSLGDIHPPFINLRVMEKRLELMKYLKPKKVYYHDALDCCSISHHLNGKHITKALIRDKFTNFDSELEYSSAILEAHCKILPDSEHVFVPSNHPNHLIQWLDENRYNRDPNNEIIGLELAKHHAEHLRGLTTMSVVEFALKRHENLVNMIFPSSKDSHICAGNEMNNHGHSGNNGAKGSPASQGLLFNGFCVTGHTHSSEIGVLGNFTNGTSTVLSMPYTADNGGTSWDNVDTVVYPSGTKTHIRYIPNGE